MKKLIVILIVVSLLVVGVYSVITNLKGRDIIGSVTEGNSYYATSTPVAGNWTDQNIAGGWGTLGSVVITKAGDLNFQLYNATSTGAVNNDSRFNKTNNLLADFPASAAAGTYTFDVQYNDGLVLEVVSGTLGTSTITYR